MVPAEKEPDAYSPNQRTSYLRRLGYLDDSCRVRLAALGHPDSAREPCPPRGQGSADVDGDDLRVGTTSGDGIDDVAGARTRQQS